MSNLFKHLLFTTILLQGVLLAATLDSIEVGGVKIPLVFERQTTLPIASMQLVFQKSGSIEDGAHPGIARFCAKMLGEGTKKMGAVAFATRLEENAIHLSAHSGTETFVIELSSLKERFSLGAKLLGDLLKDPNFTQKSFKKIQLMTLGDLKRKESDYDYIASLNLKKILFEKTPIGHAFAGTIESIEALKLEDVESFYAKHIVLARAIVVVGGDMRIEEAKRFAQEALAPLSKGSLEPLGRYDATDKPRTVTIPKETKQAYIYFGSPFYIKADDKHNIYKARVAAFILGAGGFGSRMMEEIRVKRGLAYSAYARINLNRSYTDFTGYLQTKLESQDEAIKLVREVIAKFVEKGVTSEELEQAKKFLLGSEPLRNETLDQRLSGAFLEYYKGLGLGYRKEELKMIESLKLDELNAFIKAHPEIKLLSFSIVTKK